MKEQTADDLYHVIQKAGRAAGYLVTIAYLIWHFRDPLDLWVLFLLWAKICGFLISWFIFWTAVWIAAVMLIRKFQKES